MSSSQSSSNSHVPSDSSSDSSSADSSTEAAAEGDALLAVAYDQLRAIAAAHLSREKPGHTLQPTALVHEAYCRLVSGANQNRWNSERHFLGAAALAMRRILVENARRKQAAKRGGGQKVYSLEEEWMLALPEPREDLLALDEALSGLAVEIPRAAELVQLVYFGGLTMKEAGEAIGISSRTCSREWELARAWLKRAISAAN